MDETADGIRGGRRGLSALLEDLQSPDEELRLKSLKLLETYPSLAIVRAVKRVATTDPSVSMRYEARRLLERMESRITHVPSTEKSPSSRRVRALLADPDPAVRMRVIRYLALNSDPRVPTLLVARAPDEDDPFVLCALLQALTSTGGRSAAPLLSGFLVHADPRVRATAIESLEATGDPSALPRILPILHDRHHRVRAAAIRAVRAQDADAVLACVDTMLRAADDLMVRSALFVLRFFPDEEALGRLAPFLDRTVSGSRLRMALRSLAFLARKGSVRAAGMLARHRVEPPEDEDPPADGLVDVSSSPIQTPLPARLEGATPEERLAALAEAVRDGRRDLVGLIRDRLRQETNRRVLPTLVSALGRLGSPEDVSLLFPYIDTADPRLRANAVEAVGLLAVSRAEDLLYPRLRDENNRVRANAVVALHGAGQGAGDMDVLSVLDEMARGSVPMALSAIWAAGVLATPESVAILGRLTGHAEGKVARAARAALETLAPILEDMPAVPDPAATAGPDEPPRPVAVLADDEVGRIVFDLCHDSPAVRLQTVRRVVDLKDPRFLDPLRGLLRDDDPAVRHGARDAVRAVLQALAPPVADPAVLDALRQGLESGGAGAKAALAGLLDAGRTCGVQAIARILARRLPLEEDAYLRANMLSALALFGDRSMVELVLAFTRDPDARVRANAVDALEHVGNPEDLKAAVACLADPDPRVRVAAITASLSIYRQPFLSHLEGMLQAESAADRAAGLYALTTVDIEERFDLLRRFFLAEGQPRLYESAADALAREFALRPAEEVAGLLAGVDSDAKRHHFESCLRKWSDADAQMRPAPETSALEEGSALARFMDLRSAGRLTGDLIREALASETDALTIIFLLESARDLKLPDFVDLVQRFSRSKDRRIRLAAAEALGRSDSVEARDILAALVRDRDAEVSARALERLEQAQQPSRVMEAILSLVETGQSWATRRGLEYLDSRVTAENLHHVLKILKTGTSPAIVEPVTRIVTRCGTRETLDSLSRLFREGRPGQRPFLFELGHALGERLGVPAGELAGLFPGSSSSRLTIPGSGRLLDAASGIHRRGSTSMIATLLDLKGQVSRQLESALHDRDRSVVRDRAALAGAFAVVVFGILIMGLQRPEAGEDLPVAARATRPVSKPARRTLTFTESQETEITMSSGFGGAPRASDYDWEPTVEEVTESLRIAFASQGITSDAVLEVMALDRVQPAYRTTVAQAAAESVAGDPARAIEDLKAALEEMDPRHLKGRLALVKAILKVARRGEMFDVADEYRKVLELLRGEMVELLAGAAREGGLPQDQVTAIINHLEEREKAAADAGRAADWLSGRDLAPSEPTEP